MAECLSMSGPFEAKDDFNLTVVRTDSSVLMGRKTRGFGEGQLVLAGGKTRYYIRETGVAVLPFEDEAAREVGEETGISITSRRLAQKAMLYIADEQDTKIVRIYEARIPLEVPTASTELADLSWRSAEELPYEEMPDDYKLWLPHVLAGYAVTAFFETEAGAVVDASVFRQRLEPLGRLENVSDR